MGGEHKRKVPNYIKFLIVGNTFIDSFYSCFGCRQTIWHDMQTFIEILLDRGHQGAGKDEKGLLLFIALQLL